MKKIILDLDTGIDDALAILYALGDKKADLIAVTTTYGNVSLEMATANTLNILDLVGYSKIPVYQGSSYKLIESHFTRREITENIHGVDGLGDVKIPKSKRNPEKKDAVDFLIEAAQKYKNDLTIITAGPLTNLAKAIKKDKKSMEKIDKIVLMGGALTVPGNTTPYAEANTIEDPEAAEIVFKSDLPLEVVGLDVTMRTILTDKELKEIKNLNTKKSQVIAEMIDFYFDAYTTRLPNVTGCALHDPLAVGVALNSDFVEKLPLYLTIDTKEPSRGRIIGDMDRLNDQNPTTKVCIQVDHEKFLSSFMKNLENILK